MGVGNSKAARIATMAMTTSSSISVKARAGCAVGFILSPLSGSRADRVRRAACPQELGVQGSGPIPFDMTIYESDI